MGQYYLPVLSEADKALCEETICLAAYAHDFDNGLKLMEHSWQGNSFTDAVAARLFDNPMRVTWAGDYADPEGPHQETLYHSVRVELGEMVEWLKPSLLAPRSYSYLVNHTLGAYIALDRIPLSSPFGAEDPERWRIHPLPLMTAEGNGRGGGDYRGPGQDVVGTWSRHVLSMQTSDWDPTSWDEFVAPFCE